MQLGNRTVLIEEGVERALAILAKSFIYSV